MLHARKSANALQVREKRVEIMLAAAQTSWTLEGMFTSDGQDGHLPLRTGGGELGGVLGIGLDA
jgi:hypothetical protein